MAPHSSILAWKIPWTEEPGRLQSMVSLRVGHDWVTSLWLFTFMHWRRKWQPTPVFLPRDEGAWWAAIYGVAQSWTGLKWLSSSNSRDTEVFFFLLILLIYYFWSRRFPGEGNGNPLHYSWLENPMDWRSLVSYSPWGHKRVGHNSATRTTIALGIRNQ